MGFRGEVLGMSTVARITLAELDHMIASGFFADEQRWKRVELIEGELRNMNSIGSMHEILVDRLQEWSHEQLPKKRVWIRIQNSVGIPELDSAPQPDMAWVRRRDYSLRRPQGSDVLLIVEVAETSLRFGRGRKMRLYAKAGIADYWIVNVRAKTIEVYREPQDGKYSQQTIYEGAQTVASLALPSMTITPAALFAVETFDE
jgi:Uma2 family endonuclease